MKKRSWIIILFTILVFSGCEDRRYTDSSSSSDFVPAFLQLNVDEVISGYNREVTTDGDNCLFSQDRAQLREVQKTLTRQAQIYQFDQNGACHYKSEPFSLDLTYGIPSYLQTRLRAGMNQNIYLFVATTTSQLPDIQTEGQFDQLIYKYNTLLKGDDLPFYAIQKQVDIISESQPDLQPFRLNRICSKLIVEYEIDPRSGFSLQQIRFVNIPTSASYKSQDFQADTHFASYSENLSGNNGSVTCFIPENNQGQVPSIDDPEKKNRYNSPVNATYVELTGYYKTKIVTFRIYPGANATTDFNLKRNHWYRIFLKITDVFLDDLRVDYTSADEFIVCLYDEPNRDYSAINNILLNNQIRIYDFTVFGSKVILHYTSTPGSHLNRISFCDATGKELFGGKVNYYFTTYSQMHFSSMLEAQGNGSPSDSYQIYEPHQLNNINKLCQAGYQSRRYIQQDHIDLTYFETNKWQPIGDDYKPFQGFYDGNGYSVRNLTINTNATGNNNQQIPRAGLFGKAQHAVIRNLHIRDGYIGCKSTTQGSVAALAENSLIEECSTTLKIEQYQRANAGGIVGELINSELNYCYNACRNEMTAWNSATYYTGGIAGYVQNSVIRNVYSIQALWIGNNYALGAVAGALVDGSTTENIFGELYKTSGDKIIGNPASTTGLMTGEYLKKNEFVEYLNSQSGTTKWQYQSGDYPKLKGER